MPLDPDDFYFENGLMVFTARFHLKRGYCCGNACRHCPYEHINVEATAKRRSPKDRPNA